MDQESTLVNSIASGEITFLDGVMSPTSQLIKERLGVEHFHMVSWWALTPQDWTCPGCDRHKVDIARTNHQGEAMCHLHEHHDHMKEVLEKKFNEFAVARTKVVADKVCKSFATRSSAMIIAYEPTVVCEDCNTADGVAKRLVGTPDEFSYSPKEIRRFIKPAPNKSHDIDTEAARKVWEEQEPTFKLRMKIASRIAEIAASNEHWYQAAPRHTSAQGIADMAGYLLKLHGANPLTVNTLCGSRKNIQKKGAAEWRRKRNPPCKSPPTSNDIELIKNVSSPRVWACVHDTWSCEVCQRPKMQTIKRNSKKEWAFHAEDSGLFGPTAGAAKRMICEDCRYVVIMIGKEYAVRTGGDGSRFMKWVKPSELAALIIPQPHARHNIDNDYADSLIDILAERLQSAMEQST